MAVLRLVGQEEPWILTAVGKLEALQQKQVPAPWQEIHTLLGKIITKGEMARTSWKRERQEMKETLVEVARSFRATLQSVGQVDGEISGMAERLAKSDTMADLHSLKDLLLREAESFREHARSLGQQIDQSQSQVATLQNRLRHLDEALLKARDDQLMDPFSGLPNRFSFSGHFKKNMEQGAHLRLGTFSVTLFSLDNHEELKDKLGRNGLGRLLSGFGKQVRSLLQEKDLLARLGEWEFAILMPGRTGEEAMQVTEKIAQMLAKVRFKLAGKSHAMDFSFGVVDFQPGMTEQAMLHLAGQRVAAARERGSNQVTGPGSVLPDY